MSKKCLVLLLCLCCALGGNLMGCRGREGGGVAIDETKTTLFVGAYSGAFEKGYAAETARRFEETYKDVEFTPGKKGVQIVPYTSENYTGTGLTGQTQNNMQDVYLTEQVYYYDMVKGGQGDMLEITDLVTSSMQYDFATQTTDTAKENVTLEQKMRPGYIEFLNVGTENDKHYYAVPLYESFYGLSYDVNLFETNNYFFADVNAATPTVGATGNRSVGPNGIPGDYDDGLPATYDQFIGLCRKMVAQGVAPIAYPGRFASYIDNVFANMWADYEGYGQMMLNYTFGGTANNIVKSFDGNDPVIGSEEITPKKGYITHEKQAGKYYALEFAERLCTEKVSNKGFFLDGMSNASQYDAERMFVSNKYSGNTPVGMLVDGTWWTYEARQDISTVREQNHLTEEDMRWSVMPLPKKDATQLGKSTFIDVNYSLAFITRTIDPAKIPLAKTFLQFMATETSLREYVSEFGAFPAYEINMEIGDDFYKSLPYYTQSVFQVRKNADLVKPMHNNAAYRQLGRAISPFENAWSRQSPIALFRANNKTETAKSVFEKLNYESLFANVAD